HRGFVAAAIGSVNSVGLADVVPYRVVPPNAISIAIGYAWPDPFWNIALAVEHLIHVGKWIRRVPSKTSEDAVPDDRTETALGQVIPGHQEGDCAHKDDGNECQDRELAY